MQEGTIIKVGYNYILNIPRLNLNRFNFNHNFLVTEKTIEGIIVSTLQFTFLREENLTRCRKISNSSGSYFTIIIYIGKKSFWSQKQKKKNKTDQYIGIPLFLSPLSSSSFKSRISQIWKPLDIMCILIVWRYAVFRSV